MKISQAIYTVTSEKMTVREVAEHTKHVEVKQSLKCSTEGCRAKISFVSGAGGKSDHFRTVRYSEHNPDCYAKRKEEELKEKIKNIEVVEGSLDEKGAMQRVMYLFRKTNKPKNPSADENKKRRVPTSTTKNIPGTTVIFGNPEAPSVDKIRASREHTSFRVPPRELNQISETDKDTYFQLTSPVEKISQTDNGFLLDLRLGTIRAKMEVNEAFLKGSKDVGVLEYLKTLSKFIDEQKNQYSVSVYAFCMFDKFKGNETLITANSFDRFYISISGKHPKPRKLDSFQALYVTGTWVK